LLVLLAACSAAESTDPTSEWTGSGGSATGGGSGTGGFSGVAAGAGLGGSGAGGLGGSSGSAAGGAPGACVPMPACDGPLPNAGPKRGWKHTTSSIITLANPLHRGRDLLLMPQSPQWVIGKFTYGTGLDKDLKDEEVDIWLERDCAGSWEKLATVLTTKENAHPTVEGITDSGGRIYYPIPEGQRLGIGRHRFRLVVAGDLSGADLLIEVLPKDTPFFVSDVDGTLTTQETEEYGALLSGSVSDARPEAAAALGELVKKGYRPFYLTARPEFLVARTREFIRVHRFPLGLVHTTTALGALGSAATSFKSAELNEIVDRGGLIHYAFGNTESDAEAYSLTGIEPVSHRIFIQFTDSAHGGRRIESYGELLSELSLLPPICE
jgi:phosphatidate phosphatase PAH1